MVMTQAACGSTTEHDVEATCPVRTLECLGSSEARAAESQLRAYKLGRQRWSYNQHELLLMLEDTRSPSRQPVPLTVAQAVLIKGNETEASNNDQADSPPDSGSSKLSYRVRLSNGTHVITSFYLVYPEPSSSLAHQSRGTVAQTTEYSWRLVTRDDCKKGCKGPLLHPLHRFGMLGSRFMGPRAETAGNSGSKQYKQSKYMYFAIDEASTHVGSKTFRLIAAVYNEAGRKLLGTTCSQPIRVVANNDIPQGPAHISLVATIRLGQQPCSLRQPNLALWPNSRLQQSSFETQDDISVRYSAGSEATGTDSRFPKAAELTLQSGLCLADCRSASRHQAQQQSGGPHLRSARTAAEYSELVQKKEHEARFDPADILLSQLETEQLSSSPTALWGAKSTETQSSAHPFISRESCFGGRCNLQDQAPGAVVDGEWDPQGQSYEDAVQVNHTTSGIPSSCRRSSQQQCSTHGHADDSHSKSVLNMAANTLKRARCVHVAHDSGCGLRLGSLLPTSASDRSSTSSRNFMRRGFLLPAATTCSEDDGSPPGRYALVDRQAGLKSALQVSIAELEDRLEVQSSQLRQERAVTSVLDAQLVAKQQEIQWLRNRVCQLQHGEYTRRILAARESTC